MVDRRFRVSPLQEVNHALLDVGQRHLPRVVHLLAGRKVSDGKKVAVVDAVMQQDLLRPGALDMDRKRDMVAGDDVR